MAGPPPLAALDDADWSEFLRLASHHSLMPVVARALHEHRAGLPPLIDADLARAAEATARQNLRLVGELVAVLRRLEVAGVIGVPWKGPLLAQRAYGDIRLRSFFDLDLLVRGPDMPAARDLLLADGFRTEKPMTAAQQAAYVDHQGELELVRDSDGLWLELHRAVVPTYYAPGRTAEDLWRRIRREPLARTRVWALAPLDELEALCVHGSKHRWDRLGWILDVAMMGRLLEESEWDALIAGARSHGTLRMVRLGLILAADLCAAALPAPVTKDARADRVATALAAQATDQLFAPRPSRTDSLLFHARMRERRRDRARYLFNVLFTPSGADWESLALPRPLFALYGLTRPVRLAIKYGRRLLVRPE